MPQACIRPTAIRHSTDVKKRATVGVAGTPNVIYCFVANLKYFPAVKQF